MLKGRSTTAAVIELVQYLIDQMKVSSWIQAARLTAFTMIQ